MQSPKRPEIVQKPESHTMLLQPKKEKTRVLKVFAIFFHPNTSVTAMGGAEKRFKETLKILCKKENLKITVLESAPSLLKNPKVSCNKHLLSASFHGKGWLSTYLGWISWTMKAPVKIFSLAYHEKPNIILVSNNTLPNLLLGRIASFVLRLPLFVVVHHIDIPLFKAEELGNYSLYSCYRGIEYSRNVAIVKSLTFYVTLSLLRKVKGIIAVSNFTAKTLKNNRVHNVKVFVSGNAVDHNLINSIKSHAKEKIYDGVFVGRISKEKGIFDLLETWKRVVKVKENAKLLIIGSGLELADLKKRVSESSLENNVFIRGRCSDAELYSLLKSCRIFIFPSLFEGWGIAIAEALACELPVVAYDIPALRENFGKCESVFLSPPKDIEKMTSIVLRVLSLSENEMQKLCEESKAYSKRFVWEYVANRDLEFLKEVI